ncbi:sigma factor-like helix-turn-helix DNA-binding protein [Sphingomonas abietis]|uniref:RNA polymerase sigma factor 70 region 4 type 2 domain-containing protein n=1 Tax=Sphingomonas abietis TaxID=3012344 RepID=A0ABY7NS40_9SPHN|nr:sigma factor-like helix-turn-helix DNA-binding protein [Sphingomonas abietis]WBO24357.1 hypothetical protein PBT88_09765 [Sphingomonas abietis]
MTVSDERNSHDVEPPPVEPETLARIVAALDTLPRLTRAVFLIHRLDDLPYEDVGWRCGIGVDEVTLRMADAIYAVHWAVDGRISRIGDFRRHLIPWRSAWMRWRMRRFDRRLGL